MKCCYCFLFTLFMICYVQIRLRQERDFTKKPEQFGVKYNITGAPCHLGETIRLHPVAEKVMIGEPVIQLEGGSFHIFNSLFLFLQFELHGSPLSYHTLKVVDGNNSLLTKTMLLNDNGYGMDSSTIFLMEGNKITFTHHYEGKLVETDILPTRASVIAQFLASGINGENRIDSTWVLL